jgi:hypothetical protein
LQAHAVRISGEFEIFAAAEELDAVAFHGARNDLRRIAVLTRQDAVLRLDQEHLRTEAQRSFAPSRNQSDQRR